MEVMEAIAVAAACSFLLRRRCFGPFGPVLSCCKCEQVQGSAKRRAPGCVKRGQFRSCYLCVLLVGVLQMLPVLELLLVGGRRRGLHGRRHQGAVRQYLYRPLGLCSGKEMLLC